MIEAILFFIAKDQQAFSVVEGEGFKYLLKVLRSSYPLSSRKKITDLLDCKYKIIKDVHKKELEALNDYCLTADLWTDNKTKSYLGITVNFLNTVNELEKEVLGTIPIDERSTAEYIQECFTTVMNEFGLKKEKVTVVVTDEGTNISKAVDDLFGVEKHLFCAVHSVSHIIPNVLSAPGSSTIDKLLKKNQKHCCSD